MYMNTVYTHITFKTRATEIITAERCWVSALVCVSVPKSFGVVVILSAVFSLQL